MILCDVFYRTELCCECRNVTSSTISGLPVFEMSFKATGKK